MVNLKGKENSVDPKQNSFINTLIPYILTNLKTQIFIFCTKMGIGGGTSSAEKGGWDGMGWDGTVPVPQPQPTGVECQVWTTLIEVR